MTEEDYKKAAHFIWMNPGEKLFVLTDGAGPNHDYFHVVEITLPTIGEPNWLTFDQTFPVTAEVARKWETNVVLNLTAGARPDGSDENIDAAVAKHLTETYLEAHGYYPMVTISLEYFNKLIKQPAITKELLATFGAEEASKSE